MRCIGAPVRDRTGRVVAALTVVSSTDMQHKPEWVRHLLATASAMSVALGWIDASQH